MVKRCFDNILRVALVVFIGYCLLVLGADAFARFCFGTTIDGDWFLLLEASGPDEICAFFGTYWKGIAAICASILALWALCSFLVWRWPRWVSVMLLAGAVCLVLGGSARIASFKPAYFAWDTMLRFGEYSRLASVVRAERKTQRPPLRTDGRNRLVIIGESLASRRMGVYGYKKDTTPRLARLVERGVLEVHPERRAAHQYTARALMDMLFDGEHTQTWRDRAKGYRTVLVSAQDRWERYCGAEQLLFDACDERTYVREDNRAIYDEALLAAVRKAMSGAAPWIIYVHMMGSHFEPRERVPPAFRAQESVGTADFDDYDWSVRYTDWVVAELVEMAGAADVRFTSDHGESVNTGRWRDTADDSLWLVPELATPGIAR